MASASDAVKQASTLVSQAITVLASVGPDTPVSLREALTQLGSVYSTLGYADPATAYSIPQEGRE